jgi:hypothetical protein
LKPRSVFHFYWASFAFSELVTYPFMLAGSSVSELADILKNDQDINSKYGNRRI